MQVPTLIEMLEAGVHFGHSTGRWHPKMEPYIFTERGGVHIINLELTRELLEKALVFVKTLAEEGRTILFLGTKKHIASLVEEAAKRANVPFINVRWIGGLITNFSEIKKLIQKYNKLKKEQAAGEWAKYTKREQMKLAKEVEKMDIILSGIINLQEVPDAIFVADMRGEKTAVKEANDYGVPVVGLCDTNVNPALAQYVIPGNDDATRAVALIVNTVAEAVIEGRKEWEEKQKAIRAAAPKVEHKEARPTVLAREE